MQYVLIGFCTKLLTVNNFVRFPINSEKNKGKTF